MILYVIPRTSHPTPQKIKINKHKNKNKNTFTDLRHLFQIAFMKLNLAAKKKKAACGFRTRELPAENPFQGTGHSDKLSYPPLLGGGGGGQLPLHADAELAYERL